MTCLTRRAAATTMTLALAIATAATTVPAQAAPGRVDHDLRVATFNASLNRNAAGELASHLSTGDNVQAQNVAETIQRTRPDVVLINEFDYAPGNETLFRDNYLAVSQRGAEPIDYPYAYIAPSNTGVPSGFDLNNDGMVGGPDDAWGFGFFPGQYGMRPSTVLRIATGAATTTRSGSGPTTSARHGSRPTSTTTRAGQAG